MWMPLPVPVSAAGGTMVRTGTSTSASITQMPRPLPFAVGEAKQCDKTVTGEEKTWKLAASAIALLHKDGTLGRSFPRARSPHTSLFFFSFSLFFFTNTNVDSEHTDDDLAHDASPPRTSAGRCALCAAHRLSCSCTPVNPLHRADQTRLTSVTVPYHSSRRRDSHASSCPHFIPPLSFFSYLSSRWVGFCYLRRHLQKVALQLWHRGQRGPRPCCIRRPRRIGCLERRQGRRCLVSEEVEGRDRVVPDLGHRAGCPLWSVYSRCL